MRCTTTKRRIYLVLHPLLISDSVTGYQQSRAPHVNRIQLVNIKTGKTIEKAGYAYLIWSPDGSLIYARGSFPYAEVTKGFATTDIKDTSTSHAFILNVQLEEQYKLLDNATKVFPNFPTIFYKAKKNLIKTLIV